MPKKKRLKPNVEVITTLENGSTSKVTKTWNEAMSQLGHDGQIMVEHSYLHSNILMKESVRAAAILAPAYLDAILEAPSQGSFGREKL